MIKHKIVQAFILKEQRWHFTENTQSIVNEVIS